MSAGAIAGASGGQGTGLSQLTGDRFSDLTSEEFIKVMLSELTNQDPFEPQDSQALLEQFSSLRNIESQLALQEQLENLVAQNQVASASGMIGKFIEGVNSNNDQVAGRVSSIRVQDGKPILQLETGQTVPLERVTTITDGQ